MSRTTISQHLTDCSTMVEGSLVSEAEGSLCLQLRVQITNAKVVVSSLGDLFRNIY